MESKFASDFNNRKEAQPMLQLLYLRLVPLNALSLESIRLRLVIFLKNLLFIFKFIIVQESLISVFKQMLLNKELLTVLTIQIKVLVFRIFSIEGRV